MLIIISAPSGTGKTTLCDRLVAEFPSMRYSVSCTTRQPREGELDGVDYYFLSTAAFEEKIAEGAFIEYANVHGHWYGTLKSSVLDALGRGLDLLMDIDVQGAQKIRDLIERGEVDPMLKRGYVDVFIAPPSLKILRTRLRGRGKDSDEVIERRMQQAEQEISHWDRYDYTIINDRLDASHDALRAVILAEHHRVVRD
ncbi:MAG TPA: guanylate kinase [Kiritimatiellia bacterium]|nr:guanylate kinase [Kiritimatiellia bacterium]